MKTQSSNEQHAFCFFLLGVAEKVWYLKDIGITAVWLNPIFESPLVDFGYDISNYTRIDPDFGTVEDLEYLKDALHRGGMSAACPLLSMM